MHIGGRLCLYVGGMLPFCELRGRSRRPPLWVCMLGGVGFVHPGDVPNCASGRLPHLYARETLPNLYVGGTSTIARGLRNLCLKPFARAGSRVCTSGGRPQLYEGSAFCVSGRPRGPVYEACPQGPVREGPSARACPREGASTEAHAHGGLPAKACPQSPVRKGTSTRTRLRAGCASGRLPHLYARETLL